MCSDTISKIFALILILAGVCIAEPVLTVSADANETGFPYIAEIIGFDINIRSGAGLNYYSCGKLSQPGQVVVVGRKFSWSQILPGVGVVNGDAVRVWAGAANVEPIHSTSLQTKLNTGDTVLLMGQEKGGYYKIAPPDGANLWVSTEYTKFLRKVDDIEPYRPQALSVAPDANDANSPALSPAAISEEAKKLDEYYQLENEIELERAKKLAEQNYCQIKSSLEGLVADANSGKAGKYAKYLIKRIDAIELAREVNDEMKDLKTALDDKLSQIEKQKQQALSQIAAEPVYAAQGIIRPSKVYNEQTPMVRYLIVDEQENIICYAEPTADNVFTDIDKLAGKKVGLGGTITPDAQSNLALVKFDSIVVLE